MRLIGGKYEIVRQLGEGGMGAVYEARHTGTGRRVAIKEIIGEALKKNPGMVERFQREARATGAIETQHIAVVLDTGTDETSGNPFLVMEYLSGEDMQQLIARLGPLPQDLALRIVTQACTGLARAHEAGVVHRDIKPANLFLTRRDGGEVVVKLLDFGIARVKEQVGPDQRGLTTTGQMLGSPLYMSPEQAQGAKDLDHRSDIWSLGVVLYEALSGQTPHGDIDTIGGLIVAICSKPARPIVEIAPHITPEVAAIVMKALTLDPAARYASAEAMLADLRRALPAGFAINESMLVSLPDSVRHNVEPKHAVELADTAAVAATPPPGASTTAGTAREPATTAKPTSKRSNVPLVVGAIVATVLVGGVARRVFFQSSAASHADPTSTMAASTSAPVVSAAPTVSATPTVTAATRTVPLQIVPANADVEVDGQKTAVTNGVVLLSGTDGSTRDVHVVSGKRQTTVTVAITERGPVPSRVELVPAATPPTTRVQQAATDTAPGINRNFDQTGAPPPRK